MTIIDMALRHAESTHQTNSATLWDVHFSDGLSRIGKIHNMGDFCFALTGADKTTFYGNPNQVTRLVPLLE